MYAYGPTAAWERALGGGQAGNFPVLLVGGVGAGVWHRRRPGRRIAVTVGPHAWGGWRWGRTRKAGDGGAARVEPVAAGPHAQGR
ncbi:hypothetical protein GCM10010231_02580 [Streptomyces sindenensis]|nr:hypothetical protein GCM10010231_02580 [Streptomyces sindenensis]